MSSGTHLVGAVVFAVLAVPLIRRAWRGSPSLPPGCGRNCRVLSVSIFALSAILQLTVSGLYHLAPFHSAARAQLLQLDYAIIFILIAGTYTPSIAILFRGSVRWISLALIWTAAVVGIGLKNHPAYYEPSWLNVLLYLLMGWAGIVGAAALWRRYGPSFIEPLLLGAAAYTVGAAIQLSYQPELVPGLIGPHELVHFAVLTGIAFHWRFVYQLADGSYGGEFTEQAMTVQTIGSGS